MNSCIHCWRLRSKAIAPSIHHRFATDFKEKFASPTLPPKRPLIPSELAIYPPSGSSCILLPASARCALLELLLISKLWKLIRIGKNWKELRIIRKNWESLKRESKRESKAWKEKVLELSAAAIDLCVDRSIGSCLKSLSPVGYAGRGLQRRRLGQNGYHL